MGIGRNEPCPCGSGKKYKKCCGATDRQFAITHELDYFAINKNIAYKGKIGQQRENFCIEFIKKKKVNLNLIQQKQVEETAKSGETISCRKGCCLCCSMYVEATMQECEAIVYYLYQNDEVLATFLQNYPRWRERIRENGDLFKQCGHLGNIDFTPENAHAFLQQVYEEEEHYLKQNIPCPFLHNQLCSIYEVRPYTCAARIVTSPPEWCSSENPNEPQIRIAFPVEIMFDRSFYYRNLDQTIISFMPIAVYEILQSGTYYFSAGGVPGLENLDQEFYTDPEVLSILHRYGVLRS